MHRSRTGEKWFLLLQRAILLVMYEKMVSLDRSQVMDMIEPSAGVVQTDDFNV